jgi:HTH-type transcriptional regulator / antitoxin HigA
MTEVKPIETDEDYRAALAEIEPLMMLDPEKGTPEGERLNALADAIEAYERPRWFTSPRVAPDDPG